MKAKPGRCPKCGARIWVSKFAQAYAERVYCFACRTESYIETVLR